MKRLVVCPGNHDLVVENAGRLFFSTFDEWSASLRSDKKCTFAESPVCLLESDMADFLLVNTAYHGRIEYGQVDIQSLEIELSKLPSSSKTPARPRIAIMHHHLVPVLDEDTSTTRNAYAFLDLLQNNGFSLVLHGHQHCVLSLRVGVRRMQISGVGSFGFHTPGYINTGAIYTIDGQKIKSIRRFAITLDAQKRIVSLR